MKRRRRGSGKLPEIDGPVGMAEDVRAVIDHDQGGRSPQALQPRCQPLLRDYATSSALVSLSRTITFGRFRMLLAMAILCRYPPERAAPRSPTSVPRPSGS